MVEVSGIFLTLFVLTWNCWKQRNCWTSIVYFWDCPPCWRRPFPLWKSGEVCSILLPPPCSALKPPLTFAEADINNLVCLTNDLESSPTEICCGGDFRTFKKNYSLSKSVFQWRLKHPQVPQNSSFINIKSVQHVFNRFPKQNTKNARPDVLPLLNRRCNTTKQQ